MDNFWQHCLETLRTRFDAETFDAFIKPSSLSVEDDNIFLDAPNTVTQRWLRQHVEPILSALIREHYGEDARLIYGIAPAATPSPAEQSAAPSFTPRPATAEGDKQAKEKDVSANQTFDRFIPGRANEIALVAAKTIADGNNSPSPLFLHGNTGLGKTHLVQAIKNHFIRKFPHKKVVYVTARAFLHEVVRATNSGSHDRFLRRYQDVDLLLVDDIQYIGGDKVRTQEEFFFLFNSLADHNKSIVISSDRSPAQMDDIPTRLTTRFNAGLTTQLTPPEFELRVEIVRQKSLERGISLDEKVIRFIAEHVKSNVRELEGAIKRVQALAGYQEQVPSVEMCREAMKDLIGENNRPINPELIVAKTAERFNLHSADLTSKRRHQNIVKARHIAAHLCREMTTLSLPEIGRIFGGRNHTTIMHSCEWVKNKIKADPSLGDEIKRLEATIRG